VELRLARARAAGKLHHLTLGLVVLVAGCASPDPSPTPTVALEPPTLAQVEEALDQMEIFAAGRRFDDLCAMGTSSCDSILEAERENVPTGPPNVVSADVAPDGSPARLLVVCGAQRAGGFYRTQMVVTWRGSEVVVLEPVYWSGMSVSVGALPTMPVSEPPPVPPPTSC
jgi:hypothetical protein